MTYKAGGLIQASDFNQLVGPSTTASKGSYVNSLWGTGNGRYGYGQTPISNLDVDATVQNEDWDSLITKLEKIAYHQNTTISTVTKPNADDKITYLSGIGTNLKSVYAVPNNARANGSTVLVPDPAVATTATWSGAATFTHTVTFESGDKARYFFNAGGQILISFYHPSGTGINALWNSLATACGTVVFSGMSGTATATIASTSYTGTTRTGGSGTATVATGTGYYDLLEKKTQIFKKTAVGTPAGYLQSYISVSINSNGTQGVNSDAGSTITITTVWDAIPNTLFAAAGSKTNISVRYPAASASGISNTWGTVKVTGTVVTVNN